jgi:hypothetical protein
MTLERPSAPEALINELLHSFLGVSRALLNPPNQFVLLAFFVSKVVVCEFRVFLFEFSFGDIPVALDMKGIHFDALSFVLLFQ